MRAVLESKAMTPDEPGRENKEGPQRRLLRGYLHKTSNGLCWIKGIPDDRLSLGRDLTEVPGLIGAARSRIERSLLEILNRSRSADIHHDIMGDGGLSVDDTA